jgi:hypothetical protein
MKTAFFEKAENFHVKIYDKILKINSECLTGRKNCVTLRLIIIFWRWQKTVYFEEADWAMVIQRTGNPCLFYFPLLVEYTKPLHLAKNECRFSVWINILRNQTKYS